MKRYLMAMVATAFILPSCNGDLFDPYDSTDFSSAAGLTHGMIVLGDKLDNPYTVENVGNALEKVYPTKTRVEVETTNLYVRFLPSSDDELALLSDLKLTDHPLDYEITKEGDWYHDPDIENDKVTWMYAVVDKNYKFPNVKYEIIDECFLSENRTSTRGDEGIDWDEVIRESYRMTGNENLLMPETRADAGYPAGRITVVDNDAKGDKPQGVAGVEVSCNSFVKFCTAYTDKDGYYKMDKQFNTKIRYRLVFKNKLGFAQGFNFILVPASVTTLGKQSPSGVNYTATMEKDPILFTRCAVNNAAHDFYERCTNEDICIKTPPSDLRIWLFPDVKVSSAPMFHHGALIADMKLKNWSAFYGSIVAFFSPDITIGLKDVNSFKTIYNLTVHELSHASHFAQVGSAWWSKYVEFIGLSYITSGGQTYGVGNEALHGYCEIGEMWAYYLDSKLTKQRYGGTMMTTGESFWFKPQILRYLDERGFKTPEIYDALTSEVTDYSSFKRSLYKTVPGKTTIAEQVFRKYE